MEGGSRSDSPDTAVRLPLRGAGGALRPYLLVLSGPNASAIYELAEQKSICIGRDTDMDVRIDDAGVSRRHARLTRHADGSVRLEDLGSRNGVFVGGKRVVEKQVEVGDVIQLGESTAIKFDVGNDLDIDYLRSLAEAAHRDPLTGVYNRRHFSELFVGQVAAARRHRRPLALLVGDIDHFKVVNDRHGHAAGDAVLRQVALALMTNLRAEDSLARYGGEEFTVLSVETDARGAMTLAERLRRRVAETVTPWNGASLAVTMSFGVAAMPPGVALNEVTLFEIADRALYEAKKLGRNRTVVGS